MTNRNRTQGRHAAQGPEPLRTPSGQQPARSVRPQMRHASNARPQASQRQSVRTAPASNAAAPRSAASVRPSRTPASARASYDPASFNRATYAPQAYAPQAAAPRKSRGIGKAIVAVAAAALLLLIAFATLRGCSLFTPNNASPAPSQDWSGLQWDGDVPSFYEDGKCISTIGIDVSDNQGWIDWNQVAQDGISFAIVRAGNRGYSEGAITADEYFSYNIDAAAEAGLDVGVYFFSQATSVEEAQEEADFVLGMIDGRSLQMPVVFDHETIADANGRANNLDTETITACALAFCDRIEEAGYSTMIYGNPADLWRYDLNAFDDSRPLWYAEYGTSEPSTDLVVKMWQYSNTGRVAGIDTDVDMILNLG